MTTPAALAAATGPRWTSGRECWVFRADTPEDLCGHHARLIASALADNEPALSLVYSPIFDATDGPFHVGGAPASHGLALTPCRLLISCDPHSAASEPSLHSIDLESVCSIEIGSALALGWFVVHFSAHGGAASCPVLFSAHGIHHFRSLVLGYLGTTLEGRATDPFCGWDVVWERAPAYLRTELEPLTRGLQPLAVLHASERWIAGRGRWRTAPSCISAPGLLAATPRGLLWATSESRPRPDVLSFGVNVTVVRADRVASAELATRRVHDVPVPVVRLRAGDTHASVELVIPFDQVDAASAESIVTLARSWGGRS